MKLLEDYLSGFGSHYSIYDKKTALSHYKKRDPLAHKGNFGHALIVAGSYGKIGAAVLASKACLSAGVGLLTSYVPACGYSILQTAIPEAMVSVDNDEFHVTDYPASLEIFQTAGVGPGIGMHEDTAVMLKNFLKNFRRPIVLDADALNIISKRPKLLSSLQPECIITPHPKEFDRLFGESKNDKSRFELAVKMSAQYGIIIILKGHFTGVFSPNGNISFNTTGNAGMAKGGSGDALTGIVTALLAQSYPPEIAAAFGVFIHGAAGDLAASHLSEEAMLATDLIQCIGKVFLDFKT